MQRGESYMYDTYYKWGLIMARAGEASFTFNPDRTIANATSKLHLLYKSSKLLDGFFKMRDTLTGFYNNDNKLVFSEKRTNEGGYYEVDKLSFNYETEKTIIHSYRSTLTRVKVDTTLIAVGDVTDMLGVFFYLRGINRKMLRQGDIFPIKVAVGRDLVNVQFIYQNQMIVERENVKFNTLYFKIDIIDDAFVSTKTAAEVWIGDDDNLLPIKVRSKMQIGYIEVYYKSSSSLAHPLSCAITIKPH